MAKAQPRDVERGVLTTCIIVGGSMSAAALATLEALGLLIAVPTAAVNMFVALRMLPKKQKESESRGRMQR